MSSSSSVMRGPVTYSALVLTIDADHLEADVDLEALEHGLDHVHDHRVGEVGHVAGAADRALSVLPAPGRSMKLIVSVEVRAAARQLELDRIVRRRLASTSRAARCRRSCSGPG